MNTENTNTGKKREILLLATRANTGKTTSINLLYNDFVNHYGLKLPPKTTPYGDFKELVKVNGNNIGFASDGDNWNIVNKNCEFFTTENCNICVTACRTSGGSKDRIKEFAKNNNYNISFFDFTDRVSFDNANQEKARMMLDRLKYLI